jgi:hypothetical protein
MTRSRFSKVCTMVTAGVVAWVLWLDHKRIRILEVANQELRERSSQNEVLGQQNQHPSDQPWSEAKQPGTDQHELLRLRGRVSLLHEAAQENAQLHVEVDKLAQTIKQAEEDQLEQWLPKESELRLGTGKIMLSGLWGNAMLKYAKKNGYLPNTFAAAAPYLLDEPRTAQVAAKTGISIDDFELVYHGSLNGIEDLSKVILMREKRPVREANGRWARVYVYGNGEVSTCCSDNEDYTAVEEGKLR